MVRLAVTSCENLAISCNGTSPSDIRVPTSLSYHLADIYLEELEKALSTSPSPPPAPLLTLLRPFFSLAAKTQNKATYQRLQSALFEPLFDALSDENHHNGEPLSKRAKLNQSEYPALKSNACLENPKTEGRVEPSELKKKLLRSLFEIASLPDTRDVNRRKLYKFWKEEGEDMEDRDE
jgi:ribosomal RNA-processing protein 1